MLDLSLPDTPPQLAIKMTQGDTVALVFSIAIDSVPFNLTNADVFMVFAFRTPIKYSSPLLGITISDPINGTFVLNISSAQTALFDPGVYDFALWISQPNTPPLVTKYLSGVLTVLGASACP